MKSLYNKTTISNAIHTKWAGKTVHFVKEVDSTNNLAKELVRSTRALEAAVCEGMGCTEDVPHGTLVAAEFQTAGKGRLGRRWESSAGDSVMMSLILKPDFAPQYAPMLTLVMGLSVAQAVQDFGLDVSIKWPNDAVVSRKKICGILTEMELEGSRIQEVVVGVGVNVNTEFIPEELRDKATSLYLETGRKFDRNIVIAAVMEKFEENYEKFVQTCDLSLLTEDYHLLLANLHQPVRVLCGEDSYEGICHGINENGELLVEREDGIISSVSAGEVSVRGLYSYVD